MIYSNEEKRKLVQDDYDAIADIYANSYSEVDFYKPYIDEFVKGLNGNFILDVGCGAGQFSDYFAKLGFQVKGIDFSNGLLSIARKNYPNIEFENADISEFETTILYDGIFTKDVLFHLPDEDIVKTLKMFKKALKQNGKICIIMDMPKVAGEQIFVEELNENYKIYYNYLKPEKLKTLLEQSGIIVNDVQIIKDNDNASSYATGLMVFYAQVSKNLNQEK